MEEVNTVPYVVHEGIMTRMERTNHRLFVLCILLLIALFGSNAAWIYYESQWEVVEEVTTTQDVTQSAEADGDIQLKVVGGDYETEVIDEAE